MKRNKFSLSHYRLLTCDMGYLIPLTWYEALPGDTIQQSTSCLIRVSPLATPIMHPVICRIHHWFVPNRLLWDNWEDFITGGEDGLDESEHPYISAASVTEGSLLDYMGVPVGTYSPDLKFSALPFRALAKIYNEHYRDQDLIEKLTVDTGDGEDTTTELDLQRVAWSKDYFTTARPTQQKGLGVSIPIGDAAVVGDDSTNMQPTFQAGVGGTSYFSKQGTVNQVQWAAGATADSGALSWDDPKLVLEGTAGIDINDLRLALSIQRYQEARQMYGARYVEWLRYLGVRSSDGRLQNPEFLGGGRNTIQFSEVLSHDGANTGQMAGHGIGALRTNRYRRFFEEHGIVMSLMSVVPKTIYTQGLPKKWSREVKEDYYQRELSNIGEDEVYNKEIYAEHTSPDGIFGYQARYDEYRNHPSGVSGEFLSTLNDWHMARIFSSDPALNQTFIECNPTKRMLQSQGTDGLYIMSNHSIVARRMMSKRAYNKIL